MSAAKRPKLEVATANPAVETKSEIIVDLGNGVLGRLRTQGAEEATIQGERWQQFKAELYQSDFWHHYKERLENSDWAKSDQTAKDAYNEVVEREIQRAWDESGKGSKLLRIPQSVTGEEFSSRLDPSGEQPLPDIPLGDSGASAVEGGELQNGSLVSAMKETPVCRSGGRPQRYLLTVEYLGTRFLGWQKQKNRPDLRTVQGALEDAFQKFVGQPVGCSGSSRTLINGFPLLQSEVDIEEDTGVHALANVCHVDVERVSKRKPGEVLPPHEPEVVRRAVNHFLQKDGGDAVVVDVRPVRNDFNSRFQARERTYHYRIISGLTHSSIFERDRAWHVPENLNLVAMQEAAQVLVGHHDFSSFRAAGCQAKSPVKTLDELHICEMPAFPCFPSPSERVPYLSIPHAKRLEVKDSPETEENGGAQGIDFPDLPSSTLLQAAAGKVEGRDSVTAMGSLKLSRCYVITARARSFLYHQVRLLVGTLKAVGCGVLTVEDVKTILAAKSIKATPAMAPAHGLYLAEVKYNFDHFKTRENMVNEDDVDQ